MGAEERLDGFRWGRSTVAALCPLSSALADDGGATTLWMVTASHLQRSALVRSVPSPYAGRSQARENSSRKRA